MAMYEKGTRVIDRSGQLPKGIVDGHTSSHGRTFTRVKWDNGKTQNWPTAYLRKVV